MMFRENILAVEALGKNSMKIRIKIIIVSDALTAIGGALYAFYIGGTISFAYDRVSWTFWPFLRILIGGLANNKGVLIGTLVFVTLRKFIIFFKDSFDGYVPFDVGYKGILEMLNRTFDFKDMIRICL